MSGRRLRSLARLVPILPIAGALVTVAPHAAGAVPGATSTVFVNEIHYDNTGTDTAELVEVAAPVGTELTGWSLVLYNGAGGASYATLPLAGATLANPSDGYGFATVAAAGLQNGGPDGLALVDPTSAVVQFLSYEGSFAATNGPANGLTSTDIGRSEAGTEPVGQSLQLTGTGSQAGDFTWTGPVAATTGSVNAGQTFGPAEPPPPPPPPPALRPIHEVQGTGPSVAVTSPVTVQGVLTSVFTNNDVRDAFFVQEEDADADADPATSEGIFVFCRGGCPAAPQVGDVVTVSGVPEEFFGMSQIDVTGTGGSITVSSSGNPLPTPVPVALPAAGPTNAADTFEAQEGMLVTFSDTLSVSEYFELARYGQVVLSAGGRPEQFTDTDDPSVAGYTAFRGQLAARRIILDDDNNNQNDMVSGPQANEPYPYPSPGLSITNPVRGGDTITGLTGVLHWSFAGLTGTDAWRVRPVAGRSYTFTSANPRPATPPAVGGTMKVASFNVLNYFTTLEVPGALCGPSNLECRGANTAEELARQRDKIVSAMTSIDADVLGLIEIQNDGGASVADLVAALNAATAPGTYAFVDTGTIGGDAIKTALVYRQATLSPVGPFKVLDATVDPRFVDTRNRPALVQTFEQAATGGRVTIALNHLKSKGSACDDIGDPDRGDGQGNCAATRTAAAQALVDYLATDPTGSGGAGVLIMGDLNSYAKEDPIKALTTGGYTDLVAAFSGGAAYSFLFDGQLGYLDHALADATLRPQVTGVADWHINADEVPLLDYNDELQTAGEQAFERESNALPLYQADPFRSSDHDPVLIGLDLVRRFSCAGVNGTAADLRALGYNVIVGTAGDDSLTGTLARDAIFGLGGNDRIDGRPGDDLLCGGDGNDTIDGGLGADVLAGDAGDDALNGGIGADNLLGGGGNDTLNGDIGADSLSGGDGADVLNGGLGDDTLAGGDGDDRLSGGLGGDVLTGDAGDDTLAGNLGPDRCDGGPQTTADTADRSCETIVGVP